MGGSTLFVFEPHVDLAEAESSLHLAMYAVEGLIGRARVRLDATYQIDGDKHAIAIDGAYRVGRMIAYVFAGLLIREFGEDAFRIDGDHGGKEETARPPLTEEVFA